MKRPFSIVVLDWVMDFALTWGPLPNPHYRSISVVSKLGVNVATLIWALILVTNPHPLGLTAIAGITDWVPARCLGIMVGALCVVQLWWLLRRLPPLPGGVIGYAILFMGWATIGYAMLLSDPADPIALAGVSLICLTALVALVTNPINGHAVSG